MPKNVYTAIGRGRKKGKKEYVMAEVRNDTPGEAGRVVYTSLRQKGFSGIEVDVWYEGENVNGNGVPRR